MLQANFTVADTAIHFCVSRPTVYNHLNISGNDAHKFTSITDVALQDVVKEVKESHPNSGKVIK